MYKEALERVITHFTSDRYAGEFAAAKEDYFFRTGKVFQDEPIYENRITAFLEWYVCDRVLEALGVPPIRLYFLLHRGAMDVDGIAVFEALQHTKHSLFDLTSRTNDTLEVRDLFDGTEYSIEATKHFAGVEKGDILDTRMIPLPGQPVFSGAVWMYPKEARRFILDSLEKPREAGKEKFQIRVFDLAYMKLKQDRYKHVNAKDIYTTENLRREGAEA